jgi:hydrogenase expression/formation protein HypC
MCLGIPMRILETRGAHALCDGRAGVRDVSMVLLDPQPPGTWVLVNRDIAHATLTDLEARQIEQALDAVETVRSGGSVDHLFADLMEREPQLPPHLRREEEEEA